MNYLRVAVRTGFGNGKNQPAPLAPATRKRGGNARRKPSFGSLHKASPELTIAALSTIFSHFALFPPVSSNAFAGFIPLTVNLKGLPNE